MWPSLQPLLFPVFRVWNTGRHKIKLIGVAQKRANPEAYADAQRSNDTNTSDRNATASVDSTRADRILDTAIAQQSGHAEDADTDRANGSKLVANGNGNGDGNGNGNGFSGSGSQLETTVGALNLTAPGTSRNTDAEARADTDKYHQ